MATNKITGKSYVGQTIKSLECRKGQHISESISKRDNIYFHSAIRKYGQDNFIWDIIHDDITTIDFLNRLEIFYIGYYDTYNNGYNLTLGGGGRTGFKHSEETKLKISEAGKGKRHSIESRKKISISNSGNLHYFYGKHHTDDTKRKLSETRKGEKHPLYGKGHTEESKRKMSESKKGKYIGKNNPKAIAIIINNQQFDTRKEAGIFLEVTPSTIRNRILHKTRWLDYHYVEGDK